ncbi:pyridoxamine 5'-phosphate oxidase family protein [Nocardioides sp. LML1-1-1.1]
MTEEERDDFLSRHRTCRVASVGSDGRPHVAPLWFVWDGTRVWLHSLIRSQRWTDLMRDPCASTRCAPTGWPRRPVDVGQPPRQPGSRSSSTQARTTSSCTGSWWRVSRRWSGTSPGSAGSTGRSTRSRSHSRASTPEPTSRCPRTGCTPGCGSLPTSSRAGTSASSLTLAECRTLAQAPARHRGTR